MAWKSLTATQFEADLIALGFGVDTRGTSDPTKWRYTYGGQSFSSGNLLGYLEALAPGTYTQDNRGFHYAAQEPDAAMPAPGAAPTTPAANTAPESGGAPSDPIIDYGDGRVGPASQAPSNVGVSESGYVPPDGTTTSGESSTTSNLENFGIANGTQIEQMMNDNPNATAAELKQNLQWVEDAVYSGAIDAEVLTEVFGITWGSQEWYNYVSGAQGSGEMRAKLQEAANRMAFREDFRNYYNTDPTPADYEALDASYVSPSEFANRMKAKESASRMLPQVNEMLGRTLNHQVTLAELENLAMGGQGSGDLQALIDEATRLDSYTDLLYQWIGHAPTADDYAREVAGFASVDAFKWEITVQEKMKEMGDVISNTFQKAYGYRLDDTQLKILLGQSEGWGELQKKYNKALETEEKQETSRRYAMQSEKISPIYTQAFQGGFKTGLPELPDLGGM